MYSILIKNDNTRWCFLTNSDGSQYIAETLVSVQEKVKEMAKTTPLNEIIVVKNCTITEAITVVESGTTVEPEVEPETEQNQG